MKPASNLKGVSQSVGGGSARVSHGQNTLPPADHISVLDSLRGIAALSVVLYHVGWTNVFEHLSYIRNSYLMVDVFFVLSGFVMFRSYGKRIETWQDVRRFMWLRIWRLYPLHIAFLFVFLALDCTAYLFESHLNLGEGHPFAHDTVQAFVANLVLVQSLHLLKHLTFNYPAWSISVEFYTYVIFAFVVLFAGRKFSIRCSALVTALGFFALFLMGAKGIDFTYDFGIVRCVTGFFLGGVTFALYERLNRQPVRFNPVSMGWAALATMAGFVAFLVIKHPGYSDLAVYPLTALVILLVAMSSAHGPTRFLNSAQLVWLGTVSYSVYMVHASVLWVATRVLKHLLHAQETISPLHNTPVLAINGTIGLCAVAISVAVTLAISQLTYAWIEKPFRDSSKTGWLSRWHAPAVNAGLSHG